MSDISTEQLRKEIIAILKTADLSVVSAKKVREQVEKKLKCSLQSRKKEFDSIVMDFINQQHENAKKNNVDGQDDDDDEDDENENGEANGDTIGDSDDSVEEVKKPRKRPQPTQRKAVPKKKRKSVIANDSGSESDGSDSDYEMPKKTATKKKSASAAGGNRKSTGFTRSYTLSPELSALMGAEKSPRHEVVKRVWEIIKERNLYDPKNKQYAICDDQLLKVMKVKRFRTFGMLKHLKTHFLD